MGKAGKKRVFPDVDRIRGDTDETSEKRSRRDHDGEGDILSDAPRGIVTYDSVRHLVKPASPEPPDLPVGPIGSDCMVGDRTTIEEKVSVKRSVIGKHCSMAEKVKITNSVIMDYVQVNDGCSLQGCVISTGSVIGEKCELKDCVVGSGQKIAPNSKFTNEALVADEEMMEI